MTGSTLTDDPQTRGPGRRRDDGGAVPRVSTHTHTNLSLCGRPEMTFEAVAAAGRELGFDLLVLTDHVHLPTVTDYPRHLERLRQYRQRRDAMRSPVRIVVGAEFEVTCQGRVLASDELVAAAECAVVAPNHYQLDWVVAPRGDARGAAAHELDHIETAVDWPHTEVIAHPFAGTALEHTPNELYAACDPGRLGAICDRALERGIALEIQPKFWYQGSRSDRLGELFDRWLSMGGKVALGSDAHMLQSLVGWADQYDGIAARFALTADDLWLPEPGRE